MDCLAVSTPGPAIRAKRAFVLRALDRESDAFDLLCASLGTDGRESQAAGLIREWLVADTRFAELDQLLPPRPLHEAAIEDTVLHAVRLHCSCDYSGVVAACERALHNAPDHPAATAHRARAIHNMGMRADALAAFERAVDFDPLYAEGWHYLGIARRAANRFEDAERAFRQARILRPGFRSANVDLARTWLALERFEPATGLLREWRKRLPDDSEIAADLGFAMLRIGRADEAWSELTQAARLDPGNGYAWLHLGIASSELRNRGAAEQALNRAANLMPSNPEIWAELANLYETSNRMDSMRDMLVKGLSVAPGDSRLTMEMARWHRRSGRTAQAIETLRLLKPEKLPERQQRSYWYELGRNFDRAGSPDDAWQAFTNANRLARTEMRARLQDGPALMPMLNMLESLPTSDLELSHDISDVFRAPTFLLGFPRSGITLINTMLGSHPSIQTIEERPTIETCVEAIDGLPKGYPGALDDMGRSEVDSLRGLYWASVTEHIEGPRKSELLDMFPLRTIHCALIHRLFPAARIVFVQRHPADVVLSNFMQDYSTNRANFEFTNLESTAQIYAASMRIWHKSGERLFKRICTVKYEDLLHDPLAVCQALVDFIGLPWNNDVLTRYIDRARNAVVGTSSYHQVAEPLYLRSVGRWRAYRKQMADVMPILQPHIDAMDYES